MLDPTLNFTLNETSINQWILENARKIRDPDLYEKFSQNRKLDETTQSILITFYVLLVVIGFCGNVLVIVSVVRKPSMRTARNMFIVNLAVSDTLVCIVGTPLTVLELLTKHWPLPDWPSLCKACGAIQATSIFVSTITITAIALDRFQSIIYPTRCEIQTIRVVFIMGGIWFFAILLASPLYIFSTLRIHETGIVGMESLSFCIEDWPIDDGRGIYSILSLIFQYVLPVLVVLLTHIKIHNRVHKTRLQNRRRNRNKTAAILTAIAVTYVISWLPLNVFNIIADFHPKLLDEREMTITFAVCHIFGMSSAVSNPLLYGWLNENFKKEFVEIIQCSGCRGQGDVIHCNAKPRVTLPNTHTTRFPQDQTVELVNKKNKSPQIKL